MLFNRRKFLKSTIATGAFLATGAKLNFNSWASAQEQATVTKTFSACNACASECGMWVHVKNGRVWKATGHETNARSRGKLCGRAHGALHWVYDPDRVTQPLKRVGTGKFEAISWEQASQEIGSKLKSIIAEHGPQGIVFGSNRRQGTAYRNRFMQALGARTTMTHNASCNTALTAGLAQTSIGNPDTDRNNAEYIMCIGRNYGEGIRTNEATQIMGNIKKGAKVVCVDPRLSATGAIASEWVPIRPGTDLAFILAMCNVLIKEDLYDKNFVANHVEGFDEFLAVIDEYTPEWAESITTIDADTIKRLARELASYAPKAVVDKSWKGAWGANYNNSFETVRAMVYINSLLGNVGVQGGWSLGQGGGTGLGKLDATKYPEPPAATGTRIDGAGVKGEYPLAPTGPGLPHVVAAKAKQGLIKAWFTCQQNTARNFTDLKHMQDGFLATDLTVCIDIYLNDTAMVSDYVLPECTILERDELVGDVGGSIFMSSQCVPKVHAETKGLDEIIAMIAWEAGLRKYFNFTIDTWREAQLAPYGKTVAEMKEIGSFPKEGRTPNTFEGKKVLFFNEKVVEAGFSGVVKWIEPSIGAGATAANEFKIMNGKQGYHSHTVTANIGPLAQITKDYDSQRVWINATKAAALGIKTGDLINVTGDLGTYQVEAKVTQRIHPDAMFIPGGYGKASEHLKIANSIQGINPNDLVKYQVEPHCGHNMLQEVIVKVAKA